LKKHNPWFDFGCSKLVDQRKQAKSQWLQDPSQINWDKLNKIRREGSRNFRKRKGEYLKEKINELATHNKNKKIRNLCRGRNKVKEAYQPKTNFLFNYFGLGETESTWYIDHYLAYCTSPR
jgi:hypothetical protein